MLARKLPQDKLISASRYADERKLEVTKNIEFAKEIESELTNIDDSITWTILDSPSGSQYLYIEKSVQNHDLIFNNVERALKGLAVVYNSVAHPYDSFYLSRIHLVNSRSRIK